MNNINKRVAVEVMGWHELLGRKLQDFNPTTSWNDAGLVVERMRDLGFYYKIHTTYHKQILAKFFDLEMVIDKYGEAVADTAPLAICLASLKVMEGE